MTDFGEPMVNQWYLREDTGEKFLVTDYDEDAATVEIQTENGDLDELDTEAWEALPLSFAEAPHDWTVPIDTLDAEDHEGLETEPGKSGDRHGPWREPWEDPSTSEEFDRYTERISPSDPD
jgi:hypothetical protein